MKASKKLAKLSLDANRGVQEKRYKNAKARMAQGAIGSAALSAGLSAATGGPVGAAIGAAAGGLAGALANSRGITSKRHISDKGHAKAVAKRDSWRKEMESTFKGTRYGGKEQKKFHQQITALSNQADPLGYMRRQGAKAARESQNQMRRVGYDKQTKTVYADLRSNKKRTQESTRQKLDQHAAKYNKNSAAVQQGLNNWANNFENHYQKGLSKGMNHAQAEAYANRALSGPVKKRRRRS